VRINNIVLEKTMYEVNEETLTIYKSSLPEQSFTLETEVELNPSQNLALSGLYSSGSMLCTQCEAMGFRRITYHLDRPDILTRYTVRLEANKSRFPILLSNGNKLESGVSEENPENHYVIWNDPFPKPSYLFALVAGDLGSIHDTYETKEGLEVALGIYSEAKNVNKLQHAMYSLKESMKWDERTFGKWVHGSRTIYLALQRVFKDITIYTRPLLNILMNIRSRNLIETRCTLKRYSI